MPYATAKQSAIQLTFCLASANGAANFQTHQSVNDWSSPNVSEQRREFGRAIRSAGAETSGSDAHPTCG